MSDAWYAVIDAATGAAVSFGTRVADPLPLGRAAIEISDEDAAALLRGAAQWDSATLTVILKPKEVPDTITPWQLETWLWRKRGITAENIEAMFDALPAAEKTQAVIDWRRGQAIRRAHPLVNQIGLIFGMTTAEIDDGFIEASELQQ